MEVFNSVREVYLKLKGQNEVDLQTDDYARLHKAIKILYDKSGQNVKAIRTGLEWISTQKYSWTLETLIKKWPEFLSRKKSLLDQMTS